MNTIVDEELEQAQPSAPEFQRCQDGDDNNRFELLIFSEAGKPVYSYSKRDDVVTLMPLCSALMEYAKKTQKETLQSIRTHDNLMIRFNTRSSLVFIVIHETNAYLDTSLLVDQVEAQLVSILTAKTLNSVFNDRPTFDLKRILYGSEKLLDATTNLCCIANRTSNPRAAAFLTVSTSDRPLPLIPIVVMPQSTRDSLRTILQNVIASNSKNIIFSLLFKIEPAETDDLVSFKLTTICNHHDRHQIKTPDILIILALLFGSRAQLASVESLWMPVCLPEFNEDAFVHIYIAYMNSVKNCVVMISVDRNEFASCHKSRDIIEEKLEKLEKPEDLEKLEKFDKLLKDPGSAMVSPVLFLWYQTSKHVLWWQRSSQEQSLSPILCYVRKKMLQSSLKHLWLILSDGSIFLGWNVPLFQMYAQFEPNVTIIEATEVIQRLTTNIKREQNNFNL